MGLIIILILFFVLVINLFSLKKAKEDLLTDESVQDSTGYSNLNTPYYKDEYYNELGNGLFQIISKDSDLFENVKHFDFEYYNNNSKSKNARKFYLLYSADNSYYLKQYEFNSTSDIIDINLPEADQYYLITDSIPTFSASISDDFGLDDLKIDFFDSYSERKNRAIIEGNSPNPKKVLFKFKLMNSTGWLMYNDNTDFIVRTTTINFHL